ncbi:MAG: hypothetical protein ACFFC3_08600 [Candidatus Odinarchaeota archaeon]
MNKYYCKKCNKYHHRGKIFEEHLKFKKKDIKKNNHPDNKDIKINFKTLRPIAKRQLSRLFRKAKISGNHELYKNEIVKLIKKEKKMES